jgi:hypothetical protein
LGVIDFNQKNPLKPIPGLDDIDVNAAAMRGGLAMYKKQFPDYIGVQA